MSFAPSASTTFDESAGDVPGSISMGAMMRKTQSSLRKAEHRTVKISATDDVRHHRRALSAEMLGETAAHLLRPGL